jgi:hypothetical protein
MPIPQRLTECWLDRIEWVGGIACAKKISAVIAKANRHAGCSDT